MLKLAVKVRSAGTGRVGQLGQGWLLMCDLQLIKVITSSSEIRFGCSGLYGKPMKSRFQICAVESSR